MHDSVKKHLIKLEKPFSRDWVGTFKSLFALLEKSPEIQKFIDGLHKDKLADHRRFVEASCKFARQFDQYLNSVKSKIPNGLEKEKLETSLKFLSEFDLQSEKILDPFFRAEKLFYDVTGGLFPFIEMLFRSQNLVKVLDCQILALRNGVYESKFVLPFSDSISACEQESENLSAKRDVSLWGRWDRIMELLDWIKVGIPNEEFGQNVKNIFDNGKYNECIQDIGGHIIEAVGSRSDKKPIRYFEMYLNIEDNNGI